MGAGRESEGSEEGQAKSVFRMNVAGHMQV